MLFVQIEINALNRAKRTREGQDLELKGIEILAEIGISNSRSQTAPKLRMPDAVSRASHVSLDM